MVDFGVINLTLIISILVVLLLLLTIYLGIKIVPQSKVFVIERFGRYSRTLNAGLSIIIPYLEKTILVIWTIITILVLKIFDIILAMTNGQWNTEVLANLMYDWMFRGGGDSGRGSLMAIVIMIGVIPIMIWNIRRHKEDEKS